MYHITTFYSFQPLESVFFEGLAAKVEQWAADQDLTGLVLLGPEGVNLTVAGSQLAIGQFKDLLSSHLDIKKSFFKDSESPHPPFQKFEVKIKREIVTLGRRDLVPTVPNHKHLSPQQWHERVKQGAVVLDTRNTYETEIGKFKTALDLKIDEFHDFPTQLAKSDLSKDQEILIYCTGGIRCEKAILAMEEQGFKNVSQLSGGILNYLAEFPNQEFEGECFVFDYRVAVDQNLSPTVTYKLCFHCGQPAKSIINCELCSEPAAVCNPCQKKSLRTCSKNCAHHARMGHKSSKPHAQENRQKAQHLQTTRG
jgi:UPF0176 protein